MNTNQNYTHHDTSDEISLQELFMALWRQKALIIIITLVAAIVTGLVTVFAITPVYQARLNIIMNMPETYNTKYGDYNLPISTNEQYINLITSNDILRNTIVDMEYNPQEVSVEALRERIKIPPADNKNTLQNSFDIKVLSDNPEEARQLALVLYKNYIEFIDVMVAEGAINYFSDFYGVQLTTLQVQLDTEQELLINNTALLDNTPKTINQREAMNEIIDSENATDFIVMGNIINPNYTELEMDIINNRQSINSIENTMSLYSNYLNELGTIRSEIDKYYETGEFIGLKTNIVRITKSNIYLPSEPVAPSGKTSPSNVRNVIIGTLLGGMLSVLIAFIREFWLSNYVNYKG